MTTPAAGGTSALLLVDAIPDEEMSAGERDLLLASTPWLLEELREHALDDGMVDRNEAIAMTIGPRSFDIERIEASTEGQGWMVWFQADNCHHYARFDAFTGRSTEGGRHCWSE